ncbi:MAG: type II toxin-antitoxin system VapC family toxin [Chloroflexi bacterium]|nr:type II toxin-antitoxin system VapC family toxin [Chloroflexota bacterium]
MNYLVDSDWAIHYLRGAQPVIDRLQPLTHEGVGISIISLAELYHGVFRSRNPQRAEENLNGFLSQLTVVGLNHEVCKLFGQERAKLQLRRIRVPDFDLMIGCTAVYHDLTLLTNNRRDFENIEAINIETI